MNSSRLCRILMCGCLVMIRSQSVAQSFTVTPGDTVKSAQLGSEVVFDVGIKNAAGRVLTLAFLRTLNALPAAWQSALCLGTTCYAPVLDSIALTPEFGCTPLRSGDSTIFSLHVTPQTNPGTGTVRVTIKDVQNPGDCATMSFITHATATDVPAESAQPLWHALLQNYPNPFNPATTIGFNLCSQGSKWVRLGVYDLLGREVKVLVDERKEPGSYTVTWDASGNPAGVYWCRIISSSFTETRSMILAK
jgi:hypothetical protein